MADFQTDWDFLQAALPDLQHYLLSNDLFWPLRLGKATHGRLSDAGSLTPESSRSGGSRQVPQLSIGSLALSQARLAGQELTADEQSRLADIVAGIEQVRHEWRANWARKAAQERASRLNLWQQYLRELRGDARQQGGYYANEVRQRAMLDLLAAELLDPVPAAEAEQLEMLDTILRGQTEPGPFVWEPEAAAGFPQETFWYLYRSPKK